MLRRILVVCVGNVCRSPLAAALLQSATKAMDIASAGTHAVVNEPADPVIVALMHERGFDLGAHRARQLDGIALRNFDLLLVMEQAQKHWIESRWPEARGRVYRLGHWSKFDVPDPYRRSNAAYRLALALIERGLEDWKKLL